MQKYNLFSFIKAFSLELEMLASNIEERLYEQPREMLIQSRLFSEQLVKIISDEEELEEMYQLRHSERIHKLYRNNAIEDEIYMKFEWLRKKGNHAAHNIQEVAIEDALKAHRFLFDISVWYMQVYVSYDFEAPVYKLPIQIKKNMMEIDENLDQLIKPYLDQKMRQIDDMWSEINQELQMLKRKENQLSTWDYSMENTGSKGGEKKEFLLFEYFDEHELEYVDKRSKKGALWVVGDWSIREKLIPLKKHKIYFRYSKKGGRSTEYRPAWYSLNKAPTAQSLTEMDKEGLLDNVKHKSIVNHTEKHGVQSDVSKSIVKLVSTTQSDWQEKGQILIPIHLLDTPLEKWPYDRIRHLEIKRFGELTDDILREIFKKSKPDFHKLMIELYWLGFRFKGNLEKFQPLFSNENEQKLVIATKRTIMVDSVFPPHLSIKLKEKFIKSIQDMNHMLVSSLSLLFKEDMNYVLQLLQSEESKSLTMAETKGIGVRKDNSQEQTNGNYIIFRQQKIKIKDEYVNKPIKTLGLQGCTALLNRIQSIGVFTLADIKEPIDDIHLELPYVGPKSVEKFWQELQQLSDSAYVKKEVDLENGHIFYDIDTIIIYEEVKAEPIKSKDFPGLEGAVAIMHNNGIKQFNDLPIQFSEIAQLKGIGQKKVEKLFQRIKILNEEIQKRIEINKLPDSERLDLEIKEYEKWFEKVMFTEKDAKEEKVAWRYLKLVEARFEASQKGEHLTLEVLGGQEGVTRERIRQILAKGDDRICQRFSMLISLISKKLKESHMIDEKYFSENGFAQYLLKAALERRNIYSVKIGESYFLTIKEAEELSEYVRRVQQEFEEVFALHMITKKDIETYSEERALEDNIDSSIIEIIVGQKIRWLSDDQGILNNLKKNDIIEMVMLQYPDGVEIYKREEELIEKANAIVPNSFEGERSVTSVISRGTEWNKFANWGRGIYIHAKFIGNDIDWVHSIQDIVEDWLQQEDIVHVGRLYSEIAKEAKERNIPNEYALYSLLRLYSKGTLSFLKFPMITLPGVENQAYDEWVMQYIEEQNRPVRIEELVEVFVNNRGWRRFSLDQALFKSQEIIAYAFSYYTLLSRYQHIDHESLQFIIQKIQQQLENKALIFIDAVFNENEAILKSLSIETSFVLYELLKRIDGIKAEFPRYPYIVSLSHHVDNLSGTGLIENIIKDEGGIIPRERVNELIIELFGQNNRLLDFALVHSTDILYYTKGQYGEYIHRDTINMDADAVSEINEVVKERYNKVSSIKKRKFVLLDEIFEPSNLPRLLGGINWSKELLGDILKKSDYWIVVGSFEEILLPKNNGIKNHVDFIEYLLINHFGGAVKLTQLKDYLLGIRYSGHGQILKEVSDAMENGIAPFSVKGDELIHNELDGGI